MLKSLRVFILWSLAITSSFAQSQQWQETQVGDSTTVKFPTSPTRQEMAEGIVYFSRNEQITFLTIVKQKALAIDASANALKEFYASTLDGMLDAGGGGKIVKQQATDLSGFPAMQAQLAMNTKSKITGPYFNQVVLIDGTCYVQSVLISGNVTPALLADKDHFFASFKTNKQRITPENSRIHDSAYQLGRLMGTVVFYGGLGALVLFLWRRKQKASKKG